MAYETILSILFALGLGAAIIVYAARPRHPAARISMAHGSTIESFAPAQTFVSAPTPQVTAVQTSAVESSETAQEHMISEISTPVAVADVSAAGPSEISSIATATVDVSAAGSSATSVSDAVPTHTAAKAHRTQRRKSTSTKTHAKPGSRSTKKHGQTHA